MVRHTADIDAIINLTPTERAYIAGFFDGEGCIYIEQGASSPVCKITVSQARPAVLMWLHSIYGGNVRQAKTCFDWAIRGVDIPIVFLRTMLPYLRVKKDEATEALFVMEHRNVLSRDEVSERVSNIKQFRRHTT